MVFSQAYYDTQKYETFLKDFAGDEIMASSVRDPECPKVAFVSAIMSSNRHSVSPFVLRNYAMPYMVTSNFRGSSRFKIWEAVRASSAAPGRVTRCGYFIAKFWLFLGSKGYIFGYFNIFWLF